MPQVNGLAAITRTTANGTVSRIPPLSASPSGELRVYFETKFMDLREFAPQEADPTKLKNFKSVTLEMENQQPPFLAIYIGTKENINDEPVWAGPYFITVGKPFPIREKAFYVAFRIVDSQPTFLWQLSAIELHGRWTLKGGSRR